MQDWLVMKVKEIKKVDKETTSGETGEWSLTLEGETPNSGVSGKFVMKADEGFEGFKAGQTFRVKMEKVEES